MFAPPAVVASSSSLTRREERRGRRARVRLSSFQPKPRPGPRPIATQLPLNGPQTRAGPGPSPQKSAHVYDPESTKQRGRYVCGNYTTASTLGRCRRLLARGPRVDWGLQAANSSPPGSRIFRESVRHKCLGVRAGGKARRAPNRPGKPAAMGHRGLRFGWRACVSSPPTRVLYSNFVQTRAACWIESKGLTKRE